MSVSIAVLALSSGGRGRRVAMSVAIAVLAPSPSGRGLG
jgi:hypothetical protein